MPTFAGIDHLALSVTDLDRSEEFYVGVLGFLTVLDFGTGRLCLHKRTGFTLGLMQHPDGEAGAFTELRTGLDHLGLVAADRDEIVAWERRLREAGVSPSPIQDEPLGHHLNFRDPDGIALEFYAPAGPYAQALAELRSRDMSDAEVLEQAAALVGPDLVARSRART